MVVDYISYVAAYSVVFVLHHDCVKVKLEH